MESTWHNTAVKSFSVEQLNLMYSGADRLVLMTVVSFV